MILVILTCLPIDSRLKLAGDIMSLLGVVRTKAKDYCKLHKPTIILDKGRCVAGRVTLERSPSLSHVSATTET